MEPVLMPSSDIMDVLIKNRIKSNGEVYIYHLDDIPNSLCYVYLWSRIHNIKENDFAITWYEAPKNTIPKYILTCKNKDIYDSFSSFILKTQINKNDIFPQLQSGKSSYPIKKTVEKYTNDIISGGVVIARASKEILDIVIWLTINCNGHYARYEEYFFFEKKEDAMKFKLKYGDVE